MLQKSRLACSYLGPNVRVRRAAGAGLGLGRPKRRGSSALHRKFHSKQDYGSKCMQSTNYLASWIYETVGLPRDLRLRRGE